MNDKMEAARQLMREAVKAAAKAKLGRPLSGAEESVIQYGSAVMMVETMERTYSHTTTSPADVAQDLAKFVAKS